ncbi:hypothetical protein ACS0TY_027508 [Phlomoides rotata]
MKLRLRSSSPRVLYVFWISVGLELKFIRSGWTPISANKISHNCTNSNEALRELSITAEVIIAKFKNEEKDPITENPHNWPAKVVAANSMYRITQTILLSCEEENRQPGDGLFEQLSVMIADILAACLTNLRCVITTMCHRNVIEMREKSVRKAFLLRGETEQVVELVQQKEWPHMDHDKATYIDEWRALFMPNDDDDGGQPSTSSYEIETTSKSGKQHLAIMVVS